MRSEERNNCWWDWGHPDEKEWKALVNNNMWKPGVVGTESLWEEVVK